MNGANEFSAEGLRLLLIISISVLTVTMALVGYFLSKRDSDLRSATNQLSERIDESNEGLKRTITQLEILVNTLTQQYAIRQPIVDERLKNHSEQLINHKVRLTKLESEHEIFHCDYKPTNHKQKNEDKTE